MNAMQRMHFLPTTTLFFLLTLASCRGDVGTYYSPGSFLNEASGDLLSLEQQEGVANVILALALDRYQSNDLLLLDQYCSLRNDELDTLRFSVMTDDEVVADAVSKRWGIPARGVPKHELIRFVGGHRFAFVVVDNEGRVVLNYSGDLNTFKLVIDRISRDLSKGIELWRTR